MWDFDRMQSNQPWMNVMARIPSFEELLLEIYQSLGLKRFQTKYKEQFADLGLPLGKHREMGNKMLRSILSALEMDDQAQRDVQHNLFEWAQFHKALELHTWTGKASREQVLWHLLVYSYVPALARLVAFWSLAGVEAQRPIDSGMPGGKFWFLPTLNHAKNQIELPVPQVLDWLFDLLGKQSKELAFEELEHEVNGESVNAHALRTLQRWMLDGVLPKSAKKIDDLFHDGAKLVFHAAFEGGEGQSTEELFWSALDFVRRNQLSAATLREQIPMTVERLGPVLEGNASEGEKQEFVRLLALRYAKPAMRTVRQRLRVARMVQDGYQRLLAFLCPNVEKTCTDPQQNKLLQLVALFQTIHNLTIESSKHGGNYEEQDAWFEARLAPWDKEDTLLSIVPSLEGASRYSMLAERLTRRFMMLEMDSPLEDFIPLTEEAAKPILERRLLLHKKEDEEDRRLEQVLERMRTASPWRTLQAEDSYWVISQLARRGNLSSRVRGMAIQRMRDLATTPGQSVETILDELGSLVDCEPKQRPKDVQQRVQSLLDETEASPAYREWKAPLLRCRAKHRLMKNDFHGAHEDFEEALLTCSERSFGQLRGEIARDAWATAIAITGPVRKKQEKYYRIMLGYGMFIDGIPSFDESAALCEEFFWTDLYQPYLGIEPNE